MFRGRPSEGHKLRGRDDSDIRRRPRIRRIPVPSACPRCVGWLTLELCDQARCVNCGHRVFSGRYPARLVEAAGHELATKPDTVGIEREEPLFMVTFGVHRPLW